MAIDPVALHIFGLEIYWYGITYVLGFLFGFWFVKKYNNIKGLTNETIDDICFYVILFSVLGGRIFEILFYQIEYYLVNPSQLLAVWNGGMSIHGGIFFGIGAIWYQAKKHKINPLQLIDLFIIPASLALAFGRLANFVNQEIVGKITTSSLGVIFPKYDTEIRHPYAIYLGLKNLILFQTLFYLKTFQTLKPGTITALFLILFNTGRFIIDIFKVPDATVGIITMGQFLSLCFIGIGVYILYKNKK
jgi:phosphatidylglycerol:prolipoprotein diacylglycerol transferase